jgi:hypothetical protein
MPSISICRRYTKCQCKDRVERVTPMDDKTYDPIRTLGVIALVFSLLGGGLVILGILEASPERYTLGAFVAGIPLAFYLYSLKVEFFEEWNLWSLMSADRRRRRERREASWTITPTYAAPHRPTMPATRGPHQALPLYGPGTCPACGGTLFYGRLNCPHCSEPVFRDGDGARPPEL